MATQTAPGAWWDEDDATLATVIDVLQRQAEETKNSSRRR